METNHTTVGSVKWDSGAHTQFSKNVYNTLKTSIFSGMTVTQFFMGNPKSFNRHKVSEDDFLNCKKLLQRFPLHVFSHFPYVANLAGSVKQRAWVGDSVQDQKTNIVLKELQYELNTIAKFSNFSKKSGGVVIHPGNFPDRKVGIETISKSINMITFEKGSKLLLENSAGKGCSLAVTLEEIKAIYDGVDDDKKKHIGVCIDTAHTFASGLYDLRLPSEIKKMFEDFDRILGIEKLTLIHLNDSKASFNTKKDLHELLMEGEIWSEDNTSLILLLDMCKQYNIPVVLETAPSDMLVLGMLSQ